MGPEEMYGGEQQYPAHPHPHDLHRHDDDGWAGHAELERIRRKRFWRLAKEFAKMRLNHHDREAIYTELAVAFDEAYRRWREVH